MNIKTQLCGLVLLLIGFALYYQKRTLNTYSKRAFVRFYFITLSCIVLDIASVIAIEYMEALPRPAVELVCKAYLLSLVLTALCSVMYIGVDIIFHKNDFRKEETIAISIAAVICVGILVLPIHIYADKATHVVYTYGPAALLTYVGAVGLILFNFLLIVKYRQCINERRMRAMLLWMAIWFISAIIQFLNAKILVVGFGSCLGVIIIYLQFENPEINLDRESGMFNQTAFYQFIQQIYYDKSSYAAFAFINEHRFAKDYAKPSMNRLIDEMLKTPDTYVFRTSDDEIVMLVNRNKWEAYEVGTLERIVLDGINHFEDCSNMNILYMPDCLLPPTPEDFFALLRYCRRKKLNQFTQDFICVDESVVNEMLHENEMFKKVEEAIKLDHIDVFYQPIYSTRHKKFTSAEALVRMYDADGKLLPVFDSIRASEDSGQIHEIGEIVFEKVCRMVQEEQIEQYGIEYIEINLSAVQCSDEKLAERYIHIMEKNRINPRFINLEITESATVEMKQTLLSNMKKMIEYGVAFSLDDFGTGQSNLNYIVEMPVQIIKFDREMTRAYFESRKGQFVMNAAMHMIQGMELHIVSEGIETKEQLDTMEQLGIDYIQGFYFSKPLPREQFIEFIRPQQGAI